MNYFLLNTNFHFTALKMHFSEEILSQSVLLINSHNFNSSAVEGFTTKGTEIFVNPVHTYRDIFKLNQFKKKIREIKAILGSVSEKDTLTVFSEQDYMNDAIIEFCYNRNVDIRLIEDGIFNAVYLSIPHNKLSLRYIFFYIVFTPFYLLIKIFFSIRHMQLTLVYNFPVMRMKDKVYSKFLQSSPYATKREIPNELLSKRTRITVNANANANEKVAVFVNSPHNTDIGDKYFGMLEKTVAYIKQKYEFNELHVCFHPRDTGISRSKFKNAVSQFPFIRFHEGGTTREILELVRPDYLFSYMSTALLEFSYCAKNTIYLVKEFPEIINPLVAQTMSDYIDSLYL